MSSVAPRIRTSVLADLLPGERVRDLVLVVIGTAVLIVAGQIAIPLPFTPIPLSLGSFAVLLVGATLGPLRGLSSIALYVVIGFFGAPVFAERGSGWNFASFGYILGYLAAAGIVGLLARQKADRNFFGTLGLAGLGSLAIYTCGVPWLMGFAHIDFTTALGLGVVPFLIGDAIKIVVTSMLLPLTWRAIGKP